MKRKRFSVEQIVGILKQVEVGVPVADSPARCAASPAAAQCHKNVIVFCAERFKTSINGLTP